MTKRQPRQLKVYGWTALISERVRQQLGVAPHIRQAHAIVAAASMAEVGRLVGRPPRQLFCLGETGNAQAVEWALARPRVVGVGPLDGHREFQVVIDVKDVG